MTPAGPPPVMQQRVRGFQAGCDLTICLLDIKSSDWSAAKHERTTRPALLGEEQKEKAVTLVML